MLRDAACSLTLSYIDTEPATGAPQRGLKCHASPIADSDSEPSLDEISYKRPKLEPKAAGRTKSSSGRPVYPGFRPFYQKQKSKISAAMQGAVVNASLIGYTSRDAHGRPKAPDKESVDIQPTSTGTNEETGTYSSGQAS